MQFENDIASPTPKLSPEMRYASLHRTMESGLATERTWIDLIYTCAELGLKDEAFRVFNQLPSRQTRLQVQASLKRQGFIEQDLEPIESGETDRPVRTEPSSLESPTDLREHLLDGFRFLFLDHLPLTVIVATMTFPIVVGLGGFLTAGSHFFLFPAIALIPALSVLGLVGALGRQILVDASKGLDDPPEIPAASKLAHESWRFLFDGTLLGALFFGPAIVLSLLPDVQLTAKLTAFALGWLTLPMAMALRQIHDDWRAIAPRSLFRSVQRGGRYYFAIVGVSLLLFAPAIGSVYLTLGSHAYMVISVVGPLAVAPLFIISRLLGQMLYSRGFKTDETTESPALVDVKALARTVRETRARRALSKQPNEAASTQSPTAKPQQQRRPQQGQRPQSRQPQSRQPQQRPRQQQQQQQQRQKQQAEAQRRKLEAQRLADRQRQKLEAQRQADVQLQQKQRQAERERQRRPAPQPEPVAVGAAKPQVTRREAPAPVEPSPRLGTVGDAIPDLTKLPGASVLRGQDRERGGAAARRPR